MARAYENKLYTVDTSNKYKVTITQIDNIEDATDDFMTFGEVAEMMGVDPETGYFSCGFQIRHDLIKEQLIALRQQAKDSGKKTITICDSDLMEIFKDGYRVADFVPGMRRVGDRLFIEGGVQLEAKILRQKYNQSFGDMMYQICQTINHKHKFEIDLKYVANDRFGILAFVKKFITFDEIMWNTKYIKTNQETIDICRGMWDNLDAYFKRKTEKMGEKQ